MFGNVLRIIGANLRSSQMTDAVVIGFPLTSEAQAEELKASNKRLTNSVRLLAERICHDMQSLSVVSATLSQEEWDSLFGTWWLVNHRAAILVEELQAISGCPLVPGVAERLKQLLHPNARKAGGG
jgi:hypothetical protein